MPGPADSSCRHIQRSSQYSLMPSFEFFSMIAENGGYKYSADKTVFF